MMNAIKKYTFWVYILSALKINAATLVLPGASQVVGEEQFFTAEGGEPLSQIARRFDIGYLEILQANKNIHPERPVPVGMRVNIPSKFRLPDAPHKGIVINLASYRLYYYPPNENVVMTYPVGIGRNGWNTPQGLSKIVSKEVNPNWHPTAKIKENARKHGIILPDMVPSGANPLGQYALRLTWPGYLLHGTQGPEGVGKSISAGCIRLYPEDIKELYEIVPTGTEVRIVNQPKSAFAKNDVKKAS